MNTRLGKRVQCNGERKIGANGRIAQPRGRMSLPVRPLVVMVALYCGLALNSRTPR